jgi:hypothetical protein
VNDLIAGMAFNVLIQLLGNARARNQWAKAILKVFALIAEHYKTVPAFQEVMNAHATQKRPE